VKRVSEAPKQPQQWWQRWAIQALLVANALSLIPLALANLGYYLPPTYWWVSGLSTLLLPVVCLLPLLWVGIWFRLRLRYALLNLLLLLSQYHFFAAAWQLHSRDAGSDYDIRILSLNVGAFNRQRSQLDTLIQRLHERPPDILCFQEFDNRLPKYTSVIQRIRNKLGYRHHAFQELVPGSHFGLVIFSRFPIVRAMRVGDTAAANYGAMKAEIRIYEQTLHVFNAHFKSYAFAPEQRHRLGLPISGVADSSASAKRRWSFGLAWPMIKRALATWRIHRQQLESLLRQIYSDGRRKALRNRYQVICADLNNRPYSYFYRQLTQHLNDGFMAKGRGWGESYPTNRFGLRIDYIFAAPALRWVAFKTVDMTGVSDHHANLATLRFDFHPR
jgi:endonuclease/exonuclease/phosphatase family metal-dependent hydrolase